MQVRCLALVKVSELNFKLRNWITVHITLTCFDLTRPNVEIKRGKEYDPSILKENDMNIKALEESVQNTDYIFE